MNATTPSNLVPADMTPSRVAEQPTLTVNEGERGNSLHISDDGVGADRLSFAGMSDLEHEQHIADCGRHMLTAYAHYEVSSDLQDRAEADRWRLVQAEAVKARRPDYVASLELARGLAA